MFFKRCNQSRVYAHPAFKWGEKQARDILVDGRNQTAPAEFRFLLIKIRTYLQPCGSCWLVEWQTTAEGRTMEISWVHTAFPLFPAESDPYLEYSSSFFFLFSFPPLLFVPASFLSLRSPRPSLAATKGAQRLLTRGIPKLRCASWRTSIINLSLPCSTAYLFPASWFSLFL